VGVASPEIPPQNAHRCEQPGQQHGRRIPSLSSEHTLSTCCRLVSSFLTEMVQQIHSLRASGVMSSQAASAFASDVSALRRSAGRSCATPPEIRTVVIGLSRRIEDQASDARVNSDLRENPFGIQASTSEPSSTHSPPPAPSPSSSPMQPAEAYRLETAACPSTCDSLAAPLSSRRSAKPAWGRSCNGS